MAVFLIAAGLLSACGQKGPLVLPGKNAPAAGSTPAPVIPPAPSSSGLPSPRQ